MKPPMLALFSAGLFVAVYASTIGCVLGVALAACAAGLALVADHMEEME